MTKIKITTDEWEIDGEITGKPVTPLGKSGHILFSKKHIGKVVSVVVPEDAEYVWVLPKDDLKRIVSACTKTLDGEHGQLVFYKRECVQNIKHSRFSYDDLVKVLAILQEDEKNSKLAEKLKNTYSL
jgi:putative transposon-encoded protein